MRELEAAPVVAPLVEGEGQRVLADHPHGRETYLQAALAVVAVGQEQVLVGDVVTHDPDAVGQLGQDPHALAPAQCTSRVVDGGVLADDGIEEGERLTVLHGRVVAAHHAEHVQGTISGHAEAVLDGQVEQAVDGAEWELAYLPVEMRGLDGFLGGCGTVELTPEAVPRQSADVHHARLAVLDEKVVGHARSYAGGKTNPARACQPTCPRCRLGSSLVSGKDFGSNSSAGTASRCAITASS